VKGKDKGVIGEYRGVLYCCGNKLEWQKVERSTVLDAACKTCGTQYSMDPGDDDELDRLIASIR